jgi:translation initiation factor 1 (eIF-1/SUI1)
MLVERLRPGGSVQNREIEIQGDHAERVRRYFEGLGYEVAGL